MKKTLLGIIAVFISLPSHCQDLAKDQIQHLADTMLVLPSYKVKIKKVLPSTNNIQIAIVELPYREFPSILLFSKNPTTNKWTRVFEGFSPGIQEESNDLYSWDQSSLGKDFSTKDTANNFAGDRVRQLVDAVSVKKGVIIPYQNFLHLHSSGDPNSQSFAGYTIDKTSYRTFANQLLTNKGDVYKKKDCSLYTSPAISDVSFEFRDNKYVLVAKTENKQQWTYTFTNVDKESKYLENKTIQVEKTK